jgi:hypothetical protein
VLFKENALVLDNDGIKGAKELRFEELWIEGIIGLGYADGLVSLNVFFFDLLSS